MARKSRYVDYYKAALGKKNPKRSTKSSLLGKLKELKNQEFVMNVPVGEKDGQ